jgi:penicillin-binding protein 1A
VAPPGIRWVRIDRGTGKRVFGVFPVTEDPKSSVIWEAFQPQTEPRRTFHGAMGDPYGPQPAQAQPPSQEQQPQQRQQQRRSPASPTTTPAPAAAAPQPAGLPTQNAVR